MESMKHINAPTNTASSPISFGGFEGALQALFGVIASLAIVNNGTLITVVLRNKSMLNSSYNVLILCLAATDSATGVFLLITPGFTLGSEHIAAPTGLAGQLFCRVIASQFVVYMLGKVSVFLVTCMAIERWYSVARPAHYRRVFRKKRVYGYILGIWIASLVTHAHVLLGMEPDPRTEQCKWLSVSRQDAITTCFVIGTFFAPTVVTWITYIHISVKLNTSFTTYSAHYRRARVRIVRTCVMVATLLTLCWFPNQLYYALSAYGVTKLMKPFHIFTIVFAMSNSTVNPYIHCFSSSDYRRGFLSLFRLHKNRTIIPLMVASGSTAHASSPVVARRTCNVQKIKVFPMRTPAWRTTQLFPSNEKS